MPAFYLFAGINFSLGLSLLSEFSDNSDYLYNKMDIHVDKAPQAAEPTKPSAPLLGADGNVFNLIGIAARTLREHGLRDEAKEMSARAMASGSYDQALGVIMEYVEVTSVGDDIEDGMDEDEDWCREPEYEEEMFDDQSFGGSKIRHSNDKFRSMAWQCNTKYAGNKGCRAQCLRDEDVEAAFLAAYNQRLDSRDAIFAAHEEALRVLADTTALDTEAAALTEECEVVMELTRKAVRENAKIAQDQAAYQERHNALVARYEAAQARLAEIEAARTERRAKRANITRFLKTLIQHDALATEFEEELWYLTVDRVKAYDDGRLLICFRDGCEVGVQAQEELQAA